MRQLGYVFMAYGIMSYSFPRLLSIAEETLAEFLSKATGTAVEWVQMPGMKVSHQLFFSFVDPLVNFLLFTYSIGIDQ